MPRELHQNVDLVLPHKFRDLQLGQVRHVPPGDVAGRQPLEPVRLRIGRRGDVVDNHLDAPVVGDGRLSKVRHGVGEQVGRDVTHHQILVRIRHDNCRIGGLAAPARHHAITAAGLAVADLVTLGGGGPLHRARASMFPDAYDLEAGQEVLKVLCEIQTPLRVGFAHDFLLPAVHVVQSHEQVVARTPVLGIELQALSVARQALLHAPHVPVQDPKVVVNLCIQR
mmetsp:Transcript_461/g.1319  ORF Transcript_461/g.1319 Transcript_461/m.1319 type:complete len:225 (+) Transcript_461:956-1630(+)